MEYSIIEQGMLMILQQVAKLLENPKRLKYEDIWSKTNIEPKYWKKLIDGEIIERTGSSNKPTYQWVAIKPNIYMAIETLKDVTSYNSEKVFTNKNDLINTKSIRQIIENEENINRFEKTSLIAKQSLIRDNAELCNIAFKGDHKTDSAKELIQLARYRRLYSQNTVDQDVFNLLKRHAAKIRGKWKTPITRERDGDKFVPPSLSDVEKYCNERKNDINPAKFIAYYEQKGWKVGKEKMKNWKMAIHTWEHKNYNQNIDKQVILNHIHLLSIKELTDEFKRRGYTGTIIPPSDEIKF